MYFADCFLQAKSNSEKRPFCILSCYPQNSTQAMLPRAEKNVSRSLDSTLWYFFEIHCNKHMKVELIRREKSLMNGYIDSK